MTKSYGSKFNLYIYYILVIFNDLEPLTHNQYINMQSSQNYALIDETHIHNVYNDRYLHVSLYFHIYIYLIQDFQIWPSCTKTCVLLSQVPVLFFRKLIQRFQSPDLSLREYVHCLCTIKLVYIVFQFHIHIFSLDLKLIDNVYEETIVSTC